MSLKSILKRAQVWDASFDELDNFRDLNHLIHIILDRAKKILPGCKFHFFVHNEAKKEYREELKDDIATIDERNIIITYLSLKDEIILKSQLDNEGIFKDDLQTEKILFSKLNLDIFIPFVHSFRLLGFLGASFPEGRADINEDEKRCLNALQREALLNLNAALLVDRRFAELMVLADLGKEIAAKKNLEELSNFVFTSINKVVNYNGGILYLYENKLDILKPVAKFNISDKIKLDSIEIGKSISGMVGNGGKPLLIKNLSESRSFQAKNKEPFLTGSVISIPLKTKRSLIGVLTIYNDKEHAEFTGENLHLISIFANFAATSIENLWLYDELEKSYFDTVGALVGALDASDPYTRGHSDRVMTYSEEIAKELNIDKEFIRMIKFGALLHDIGKIGISGDIIRKPARLTEEEYEIIMKHPEIGGSILTNVDFLKSARKLVMYHHERLDGNGYPYKLKGKDIPLGVRILQVSDVFDALSSERPYRKALKPEEALEIMICDIGKHFDIKIIEAFIRFLKGGKKLKSNFKIPKKYHSIPIEPADIIL